MKHKYKYPRKRGKIRKQLLSEWGRKAHRHTKVEAIDIAEFKKERNSLDKGIGF